MLTHYRLRLQLEDSKISSLLGFHFRLMSTLKLVWFVIFVLKNLDSTRIMVDAVVRCLLLRTRDCSSRRRISEHYNKGSDIDLMCWLALNFKLACFSHKLILSCYPLIQETPDEGWHELVSKGYIEYIDTEEEETTMISMTINVSEICMCIWLNILWNPCVCMCGDSSSGAILAFD